MIRTIEDELAQLTAALAWLTETVRVQAERLAELREWKTFVDGTLGDIDGRVDGLRSWQDNVVPRLERLAGGHAYFSRYIHHHRPSRAAADEGLSGAEL